MKLSQWIKLDKPEREKLVASWLAGGDVLNRETHLFTALLAEAANALGRDLAYLPQVTGVAGVVYGGGGLLVTTSLPKGNELAEVPKEYAHFRVLQFGVAEMKRDYLVRVEFVFRAAGMAKEAIERQIAFFDQELRNIHTPFYCDTPAKWIAEFFVAERSKGALVGERLGMFHKAVHELLWDFFQHSDPATIGFEPSALSRLGNTLRSVCAEFGL